MSEKIPFVAVIVLLSLISCAQVKQGERKTEGPKVEEIKAKAEETLNSFLVGDHQKYIDLTYPKLVELMGGREKMISSVEQQMKEMKAQGFEPISTSVDVPKEIVQADSQNFAIVPYTLKLKTPQGIVTQQSYMLAISNKDNVKWTFIDVTDLNESQLKAVVPSAVGKLTFPKKQMPVIERNP
jgi:type III secretory pathway component EscV